MLIDVNFKQSSTSDVEVLPMPKSSLKVGLLKQKLQQVFLSSLFRYHPGFKFDLVAKLSDDKRLLPIANNEELLAYQEAYSDLIIGWTAEFPIWLEFWESRTKQRVKLKISYSYNSFVGFENELQSVKDDFDSLGKGNSSDFHLRLFRNELLGSLDEREILSRGLVDLLFCATKGYSSLVWSDVRSLLSGVPEHPTSLDSFSKDTTLDNLVNNFLSSSDVLLSKIDEVLPTVVQYLRLLQKSFRYSDNSSTGCYSEASRRLIVNIFVIAVGSILGLTVDPEHYSRFTERVGNGPFDYFLEDVVFGLSKEQRDEQGTLIDDGSLLLQPGGGESPDSETITDSFIRSILEAKLSKAMVLEKGLPQLSGQLIDLLRDANSGDKRRRDDTTVAQAGKLVKGILSTGQQSYFFSLRGTSCKPLLTYYGEVPCNILPKYGNRESGVQFKIVNGVLVLDEVKQDEVRMLLVYYVVFMRKLT